MADEFREDQIKWAISEADLERLQESLADALEITLDLETTGLDERAVFEGESNGGVAARIVMAQFSLESAAGDLQHWVLPLSHPESPWQGSWASVLEATLRFAKAPLIGQNLRFDLRWIFAHTGLDLSAQLFWDTRLSSHLLDENSSTSLKTVASKTFGIPRWDDFDLSTPGAAEQVPIFALGFYGAMDTAMTQRLARHHRARMFLEAGAVEPSGPDELEDARLGVLAKEVVMPTASTLASMEIRGIRIDPDWVATELIGHEAGEARLTQTLAERYPEVRSRAGEVLPVSFAPTSRYFLGWSAHAILEGQLRVAALTPGGRPQWNHAILARQAYFGSDVAVDLLALRSHSKKAQFLRSWQKLMVASPMPEGLPAAKQARWEPITSIHASYNVGSVVTGRLSSSNPNIQQITGALKPAFIPRPGFALANLDFSQIELRLAAAISGCVPMIEAFQRGDDLHALLAARIGKKPVEEVTKAERQRAKTCQFFTIYAGSAEGLFALIDAGAPDSITMEDAEQLREGFFQMWPGMAEWHHAAILTAQRTGQVSSPIGRVRRLLDIHSGASRLRARAERAAINAPVQGFASDLMQLAAASIEGRTGSRPRVAGAFAVATVHDSLVLEVPLASPARAQAVAECRSRMENIGDVIFEKFGYRIPVPLVVDSEVGTRWSLDDLGVAGASVGASAPGVSRG